MGEGGGVADLQSEARRLIGEGRSLPQVKIALEQQGFGTDAIAAALDGTHGSEHDRNSTLLAVRDVFDRIGYGAATPQFVNILFWLSAQGWPHILFLIGILNGLKMLLSVVWSNILQEYNRLHMFGKNAISTAGIVFGFSFLVMAFALLIRNVWLFSAAFLVSVIGVVAYGDLYREFARRAARRERMGPFAMFMARFGVLITAAALLFTGFLLDVFPMQGVPWSLSFFGATFDVSLYGYLLAFEVTAFSFILAGYVTSFIRDSRERESYRFGKFLKEYYTILRGKVRVFFSSRYVLLLSLAGILTGLLQVVITAYSGIAIYRLFAERYSMPFLALSVVYAIAIVASFTGPFFTQKIHRSTGLAPTMVFGTLLMAVFPIALAYSLNITAITAALAVYVIGGATTGFGQGMLARKLLPDDQRRDYFRAQSFILVVPYLIMIPVLSLIASQSLELVFTIAAIGLAGLVMPIYFSLVIVSQRLRL